MYEVKIKQNGQEISLGFGNWEDSVKLFNETKNDDGIQHSEIGIYDETGELIWN